MALQKAGKELTVDRFLEALERYLKTKSGCAFAEMRL